MVRQSAMHSNMPTTRHRSRTVKECLKKNAFKCAAFCVPAAPMFTNKKQELVMPASVRLFSCEVDKWYAICFFHFPARSQAEVNRKVFAYS